ncbi:MAG: hypothetical protein LBJ67_09785, partial [Planctomycetaceae bacterium]|nr:hypothetical protein [Planctomycetaceae bacterium]
RIVRLLIFCFQNLVVHNHCSLPCAAKKSRGFFEGKGIRALSIGVFSQRHGGTKNLFFRIPWCSLRLCERHILKCHDLNIRARLGDWLATKGDFRNKGGNSNIFQ